MNTKRSYICQIRTESGAYRQREFKGIIAIKEFLRANQITISDHVFSHLQDESLEFKNSEGLVFEVEMLPESCNEIIRNGIRYIPIGVYSEKYQVTRRHVRYAYKVGWIKTVLIDSHRFVEDKEIEHR